MKLLFVNSSLTGGGSEKALLLVAQALVHRGYDVTMALVREKDRTYPVDPRINIKEFEYGSANKARILSTRLKKLRALIKHEKFDYVVCYMWDLNIITLAATLGLGVKVIVSERSFPGASTRSRYIKLLERVSYRFAHKILYQTPDAQEHCPPELKSKSIIVPNIIENQVLEPIQGARSKRIVSAGRLTEQKNFPLLLDAFAQFRQAHPEWILEIYGQGPLELQLRSHVEKLGLNEVVTFVGYVSDIAVRIQEAGMFVLSSDYEGISNAMTEAMSLGIPTVCTDCPAGGAALMIQDGVSGLLVPVGEREALAHAMIRIADDPMWASTLSEGALGSVKRFAPENMANIWEQEVLM